MTDDDDDDDDESEEEELANHGRIFIPLMGAPMHLIRMGARLLPWQVPNEFSDGHATGPLCNCRDCRVYNPAVHLV